MDRNSRVLLFLWLWCFPVWVMGQDRYAVHYKYKPQNTYSLESGEEFILQKSLDRRIKEGIALDSTDLPVSTKYVETVSSLVDKVNYHSKWLNASIVVADQEQAVELEALPFVGSVELVAKGFYTSDQNGKKELLKNSVHLKLKSKKVNSYDFQNDILGIPAMHEEGFSGEGVMVAVFDAGFLNADKISGMEHLFEKGRIIATKDLVLPGSDHVFRADGHGTASLSLMAAYEPSQLVGGAYDAQYILCITEDVASEYRIEEYNWIRAAEFSDSLGVDIINSSLGYNFFDDPQMNYSPEDLDGQTAIISKGAVMAANKGILVVSSAGNEGNGNWKTLTAPADADGILSVGSVDNSLDRSGFSSIGPTFDGRIKPDLVAFGSGVTIWRQMDSPNVSSGTSFSSPQIAALAAGLWQAKPEWTREQLIHNLLRSGSMADSPDSYLGFGVPNFMDAYYGEVLDIEVEEKIIPVIFPNPLDGDQLYINFGGGNECNFKMISGLGQIISEHSLYRISRSNPFEVSLENTQPGLYLIEVGGEDKIQRWRLLRK